MPQPQGDINYLPRPSKVPLISLVARVVTLVSLIIAIVVMKTNRLTIDGASLRYKDIRSYRYMLVTMVVGFAYSTVQIPFAIYFLRTGKRLINRYGFLQFDLYGDKATAIILASGVGAAFGATSDLSYIFRNEKVGDFFSMAYLSSGFLLIALLSSAVSSIISSMALSKKG